MLKTMKTAAKKPASSRATSPVRASRIAASPDVPEDIRDAVSRLKRERIVAAAVDLFYHQGFARTTLDQVAEAIQVTKPFIYTYFKSKNDLLADICARGIRHSHEALNRAHAMQGTPTERLKAVTRDFMLAVLNHQAHAVIYSREEKELLPEHREEFNEMRREFDRRLVTVLEDGVAAGEFIVEDVHLTALAIVGIVGWSQVWYRPSGRLSREETANGIASLVLTMVHAKPAPRRRTSAAATKQ